MSGHGGGYRGGGETEAVPIDLSSRGREVCSLLIGQSGCTHMAQIVCVCPSACLCVRVVASLWGRLGEFTLRTARCLRACPHGGLCFCFCCRFVRGAKGRLVHFAECRAVDSSASLTVVVSVFRVLDYTHISRTSFFTVVVAFATLQSHKLCFLLKRKRSKMQTVERVIHMRQGPPWGFRLADSYNGTLVVSQIRRQSPAELAGLRENDVVLAINNYSTTGLSHSYVIDIINQSDFELDMVIQRQERRKPQMMTFFLDTSAARGQQVKHEMASRDLEISWRREPTPPPPEPERIRPASPDVTPVSIDRLMREYEVMRPSPPVKKRTFADSAFYAGTNVYYPSMEEQIEMARRVAKSIEAPVNQGSRGAKMFEVQQHRADKYIKEGPDPIPDPFENATEKQLEYMIPPAPPPPPPPAAPSYPTLTSSVPPPPPPPPPPPGQPRSIQEYIEKLRKFPKNTHTEISPQVCFNIAAALHSANSRGGEMFAKRRAKAQNWEIESEGKAAPVLEPKQVEKPRLVSKLDQQHQQQQINIWSMSQNQQGRGSITDQTDSIPSRPQPPNMGPTPVTAQWPGITASNAPVPSDPSSKAEPTSKPKWRPVKFNIPQKAS